MKLRVTADGSDRAKDGLATFTLESNELPQTYTLDLPYRDVYRRFGQPDPKFLDFAVVSSLCYVIDKVVPRSTAEDNWTRTLEVSFAVSDAFWRLEQPRPGIAKRCAPGIPGEV